MRPAIGQNGPGKVLFALSKVVEQNVDVKATDMANFRHQVFRALRIDGFQGG